MSIIKLILGLIVEFAQFVLNTAKTVVIALLLTFLGLAVVGTALTIILVKILS